MISEDELRWVGADLAVQRLWEEFEQNLSRTLGGRLALRLARLWVRRQR